MQVNDRAVEAKKGLPEDYSVSSSIFPSLN